jgi:putative transposase
MSLKSYKYRFYPNNSQKDMLSKTFGCTRFVYNYMLKYRTDEYHNGNRVNYNATSALLTQLKKENKTDWLQDVSSVPLQQSLRHLQTSFSNFFSKRTGYPTFKKKNSKQSAEFTRSAFKFDSDNNILSIAKLGSLKIKWSRYFTSYPTTITLSKDSSDRYFVSFKIDEPNNIFPKTNNNVGLDLGITHLVTISDGKKINNPKHTKKYENRLKLLQQRLSRREKGSNRRNKAKLKVAKLHAKISDSRSDFLHKTSTKLIQENQLIAIEDLSVRNMVQNSKLSKIISDCGWSEFVRQLEYKADWYGKTVVKIDRFFPSSKRCSHCGFTLDKLSLNIRKWSCPDCKTEHDRDINAAINILAVGQTVLAQGQNVRPKRT